jgi:hypothetical protein
MVLPPNLYLPGLLVVLLPVVVKLSAAFGDILERWGRPGQGSLSGVLFNGGMWLAGNTSLTPLMLVWE